jgi:hypothetical protein
MNVTPMNAAGRSSCQAADRQIRHRWRPGAAAIRKPISQRHAADQQQVQDDELTSQSHRRVNICGQQARAMRE